MPLSPDFWETHYQSGTPRWDLGHPAPALTQWIARQTPQGERVLVLGCGRGHDVLGLATAGYAVVGVDYAPSAIAAAQERLAQAGLPADWVQRDIFDLLPDYAAQFDYVVEHTCFCALDPALRDDYVALVRALLKPGGQLIAIFFTHDRPDGPPYGTTPGEIRQRFGAHFTVTTLEPVTVSVPNRQGEEHFACFQRRDP